MLERYNVSCIASNLPQRFKIWQRLSCLHVTSAQAFSFLTNRTEFDIIFVQGVMKT
jgi:hypothetical protein